VFVLDVKYETKFFLMISVPLLSLAHIFVAM